MKGVVITHHGCDIRRYREGDEFGIVELINQELNPEYELNVWKWKYKENPINAFPNTWIAEDKDKIVGHFAINPVMMKWKNIEILGSQAMGVATHNNYQRKGIFKTLAYKVTDEAGKKGIPITYVFPNPNSYPGFIKIGWIHAFSFIVMAKVLNVKEVSSKFNNNIVIRKILELGLKGHKFLFEEKSSPSPRDIAIFEVNFFDESFDILWKNVSKYYDYLIKRDHKYLFWRYSHQLEHFKIYALKNNNNLVGYTTLKCKIFHDIKVGYIYDLFCNPNEDTTIEYLISKAIEHFIEKGMDLVQICVLKDHPYYNICKRLGFLNRSQKPFVLHINVPTYSKNLEEFEDPKRWFLSLGDLYHD